MTTEIHRVMLNSLKRHQAIEREREVTDILILEDVYEKIVNAKKRYLTLIYGGTHDTRMITKITRRDALHSDMNDEEQSFNIDPVKYLEDIFNELDTDINNNETYLNSVEKLIKRKWKYHKQQEKRREQEIRKLKACLRKTL